MRHSQTDYNRDMLADEIDNGELNSLGVIGCIGSVHKAQHGKENEQTLIDASEQIKGNLDPDDLEKVYRWEVSLAARMGEMVINSRLVATGGDMEQESRDELRRIRERLSDLHLMSEATKEDIRNGIADIERSTQIAPDALYVNEDDPEPDDLDKTSIAAGFLVRNLERDSVFG